jgi:hypothetical protein
MESCWATLLVFTALLKPTSRIATMNTPEITKNGHSFPNNSIINPAIAPPNIPIPLIPTALRDMPFIALSLPTMSTMKDWRDGLSNVRMMPLMKMRARAWMSRIRPDMIR